ncbi:helix-turn-helix domain-containing protein [Zhaonella formicivorans]|uniref:helix-turn-helix domain-containing protein n=1 Tax=Zhaonella formicivorans TaxID=2528593 RepID=UPI0010D5165B|nr:helix-turn-helix transcriptional regulator [Zhaonella formicivorans]
MLDIGERLRTLRKVKKISANKLAKMLNVDPSTISKIENSSSMPSIELLSRACNALGVTLSDFFSEDQSLMSPKTQKLIEKISELSDESIEHLEKQAELLKIKESLDKATDETSVTVLKEGSSDS